MDAASPQHGGGSRNQRWRYPHPTVNTPNKLIFMLLLALLGAIATFVIGIHVTWWTHRWPLRNGTELVWGLRLPRIFAAVNCDSVGNPLFHAVCMSVLKVGFGTTAEVRDFYCGLSTAPLKIEPDYEQAARAFAFSCFHTQEISRYLTSAFWLVMIAGIFDVFVILVYFASAYRRFDGSTKKYYWSAVTLQTVASMICLATGLLVFIAVPPELNRLFLGVNPADVVDTHAHAHGSADTGFYFILVLAAVHLAAMLFTLFWLPVVDEGQLQLLRRRPGGRPDEKEPLMPHQQVESSSFWAYMPEVFQPEVYVAEFGPLQPIQGDQYIPQP